MTWVPGAWLGLASRLPDATDDLAMARVLTALLAVIAGWLEMRGRRRAALTSALAAVALATGFWSLALRRPYGVLVDPETTIRAADTMVTARSGGTDRFLAGEPGEPSAWRALARQFPPDLVLSVPSLLPPVILLVSALAVALLWPPPPAGLAAILWGAAATGALDSLRRMGLLDLVWQRPGRAIAWTAGAVLVLALARWSRRWPRGAVVAMAIVMASACLSGAVLRPGLGDAVMLLTFDQHVWLVGGAFGLGLFRDRAAATLVGAGGALVLVSALTGAVDGWTAAAFYRLGLILASSQALEDLARRLTEAGDIPGLGRLAATPERAVTAAAVTIALAGGYVAWWSPPHTDPVAKESLAPIPQPLLEAMDWITRNTDPRSSFIANADYAPALAVMAGRRVLRAPGLLTASDDERRRRLEEAVLTGRSRDIRRQRYDLRYVFLGLGQFLEYGLDLPEQLESRGRFRLLYANDKGMRLYEIEGERQ